MTFARIVIPVNLLALGRIVWDFSENIFENAPALFGGYDCVPAKLLQVCIKMLKCIIVPDFSKPNQLKVKCDVSMI